MRYGIYLDLTKSNSPTAKSLRRLAANAEGFFSYGSNMFTVVSNSQVCIWSDNLVGVEAATSRYRTMVIGFGCSGVVSSTKKIVGCYRKGTMSARVTTAESDFLIVTFAETINLAVAYFNRVRDGKEYRSREDAEE